MSETADDDDIQVEAAGDKPEPATATHAGEDEVWPGEHPVAEERLAALEADAARLAAELAETKDRYLRARADYDNLVKRQARESQDLAARAVARVIEPLLAPLETLGRAVAEVSEARDAHARGLLLVHQQLKEALAREGLEEVPGVGNPFDHNNHEAVAAEPSERPEGEVTAVVRTGYRLHGKLLRAALVKVSAGPGAQA